MKIKEFTFKYKLEGVDDSKAVVHEIEKLEGVISSSVSKDGFLTYELSEWTDEYDVLTASMSICEAHGGELIVDDSEQIIEEEKKLEDIETNVSDENELKNQSNQEQNVLDNRAIEEDSQTKSDDSQSSGSILGDEVLEVKDIDTMRKKLKTVTVSRIIELSISVLCLILGLCIKGDSANTFSFASFILIFSYAASIYEILFFAFKSIIFKKFDDNSIVFSLITIGFVLSGQIKIAAIISLVFAIIKAITLYSERKRALLLAQSYSETMSENEAIKSAETFNIELSKSVSKKGKTFVILKYLNLAFVVFALVCLIPALKLVEYVQLFLSFSIMLSIFFDDFFSICKLNAIASARSLGISYNNNSAMVKVAKANAFEIKASVLVDEEGQLKDDSIGAMKESILLGIKSLKTDFDIQTSQEIRDSIDFVDKDFKGKQLIKIGKTDSDINICENIESQNENRQGVNIASEKVAKIPLCYRIANRACKSKLLGAVLSHICVPMVIASVVLAILHITTFSIWFAVVSMAFVAVSSAISITNFTKE